MSWHENKQTEKESLPVLGGLCTKSLRHPWPCFLVYYTAGLPSLAGLEVLEWIQRATKWFLWGKVRRWSLPPLKGERARGDPVMIFKVYTEAFLANVMDCSWSSLRIKLKNWPQFERNDFLQEDFSECCYHWNGFRSKAIEFSPRGSLLTGYLRMDYLIMF